MAVYNVRFSVLSSNAVASQTAPGDPSCCSDFGAVGVLVVPGPALELPGGLSATPGDEELRADHGNFQFPLKSDYFSMLPWMPDARG
jgi:hypothetical protein